MTWGFQNTSGEKINYFDLWLFAKMLFRQILKLKVKLIRRVPVRACEFLPI